jgi:nucleolar complex protein 3
MVALPAVKRRKLTSAESGNDAPSATVLKLAAPSQEEFYKRASQWNLEQAYESRPRKQKKKDQESTRLPIKTAEGRVEQFQSLAGADEDQHSFLGSDDDGVPAVQDQVPFRELEPQKPLRQQILEAKEELARLAGLLNRDPEENAGAFRALGEIAASKNPTIKRLGLATQLTVYKDAIPGYRIRPLDEDNSGEKVSKEVRHLRSFEQSLVSSYQAYVKELSRCARPGKAHDEAAASVAQVAISCACALLLAVPHFNFRGELLKILINKLSERNVDANFVKCRETLETLFQDDEDGTPSLDAVTLLTRMMKSRDYRVHESVLNTFLHLRLLSEFSSKASRDTIDKPSADDRAAGKKPKQKREFRTKKERKILKEQKSIDKEFKEADAIVNHEERDRMQAETLKLVFVAYFRILKARSPDLMGAVLEGLAKYAHLINQDFFGDILEALKDLINDAEALSSEDSETPNDQSPQNPISPASSTRSTLLCINTAFALLDGQDVAKFASSLSLDLSFFTTHLYKSLYALALNPNLEYFSKSLHLPDPHAPNPQPQSPSTNLNKVNLRTTASLLHSALTSALTSRTTPPLRVAAFTKQLFTALLQTPEKSSIALLSLLSQVLKMHGRKVASLWNTEERKGDGVFDALRGEVEGSNPFASTVWEGELLRLHYARGVRQGVGDVERIVKGLGS